MKLIPKAKMEEIAFSLRHCGGLEALAKTLAAMGLDTAPVIAQPQGVQWMNQRLAAKKFGVCYDKMRSMVAAGVVKAKKIDRLVLVEVNSLQADNQQQKEA